MRGAPLIAGLSRAGPAFAGLAFRTVAAAVVLGGAIGCGTDELAPSISQLRYVDQVPQKPLVLRFEVTFADADGDLGLGTLHLELDGVERSELALDEVFAAQIPPLARDAEQGLFQVQVELEPPVEDGRRIEITMWLVDRSGATSNDPSVTLEAQEMAPDAARDAAQNEGES